MLTTTRRRRSRFVNGYRIALTLLLLVVFQLSSLAQQMNVSNVSYTRNSVDVNKRSVIEVDPTTLALNIELPLGEFGARGAGLPVGLHYNSKVWRVNSQGVYEFPSNNPPHTGPPFYLTQALYSEYSTAGWTNTLSVPFLEDIGGTEPYAVWFNSSNLSMASGSNSGLPWDEFYTVAGPPECEEHPGTCIFPAGYYVTRLRIHMPDGSSHELRCPVDGANAACASGTLVSVDGSHLRYKASSQTLYLPDGSHYLFNGTDVQFVDSNGNTLTYAADSGQWTDTLGRHFTTPPATYSTITGVGNYDWSLPGTEGPRNYAFHWQKLEDARTDPNEELRYDGDTYFGEGPGVQYLSPSLFTSGSASSGSADQAMMMGWPVERHNPIVLTEVTLPNQKHFLFSYNIYGEIDKVTMPGGGYKRFRYDAIPPLGGDQFSVYAQANRGVVEMWESPSGQAADEIHWTFGVDGPVYVIAPDGSRTDRTLYQNNTGDPVHFGFNNNGLDALTGKTIEERSYDAQGEIIRRTVNTWECTIQPNSPYNISYGQSIPIISYASRDPRLVTQTQIMFDTGENAPALTQTTTFEYDADWNVIAKNTYDFVSVDKTTALTAQTFSHPTLLRRAETTFFVNDPNIAPATRNLYRGRNLVELQTVTAMRDGNNNLIARSEIRYDETSLAACPGISNWTDPGNGVPRGNPTTNRQWVNTNNTWIERSVSYDQAGNVVTTTDAMGNVSTISYQDSFSDNVDRHTYAYETSITTPAPDPSGTRGSPVGLTATTKYDFNTGLATSSTDANGRTTTLEYNDPLNRLRKVNRPDGGWTSLTYVDTPGGVYIRTQELQQSTPTQQVVDSYQYFDGVGRPIRSYLYDGLANTPWIVKENKYDEDGRISQVSNPYRVANLGATAAASWTTSVHDVLGRVISLTTPDNSTVSTSYAANLILVTDQAGKKRMSQTNALGQLTDVWEITPQDPATEAVSFPDHPEITTGYHTAYTYNLLGDLLTITQGTQAARTFSFDSLQRLLSAANPENGTVNYQYDDNGNVTVKSDSRGVSAHFKYDGLNRPLRRWYNGSPSIAQLVNNIPALPPETGASEEVNFYYDSAVPNNPPSGFARGDSLGQLVSTIYGGGGNAGDYYGYDLLGRVAVKFQRTGTVDYQLTASYDLAGKLTSLNYPSGRNVSFSYDVAGRQSDVSGNLGDGGPQRNYATGIVYDAASRMTKEQFGTTTPIYNKLFYNLRGQLAEILDSTSYTGPADTTFNRGRIVNDYSLQCSGVGCNATDNNGNLRRQSVYVPNDDQNTNPTSWYQQYEYDSLSRLTQVHEHAGITPLWQQTYGYDRFGNRTIDYNATSAGIARPQFALAQDTNRLYAPGDPSHALIDYDQVGNQKKDYYTESASGVSYDRQFDAENRLKRSTKTYSITSVSNYTYDGDGKRVKRDINNTETWQVYGIGGELLAEYAKDSGPATPQKEYGYRNSRLLITADAATTLPAAPLGLTAAPANNNPSSNSVILNWTAASGATNYLVERKGTGSGYGSIGTTATTTITDAGAVIGEAYLYRVCAANVSGICTSGFSNIALGSSFNFPTDPTITTGAGGTPVKLEHITELRLAVNAVRHLAGMGDASWTHPTLTRYVSLISKDDVENLRDRLDEALVALGIQTSSYDDQPLAGAPSGTQIRALHITQLRVRSTSGFGAVKLQPLGATASSTHSAPYDPSHAINGNLNDLWSAGNFAPQWIQLDLGQLAIVSRVRLLVDQSPNGHTTHQIYGGATPGNLSLLGTFDGDTSHHQWLELNTASASIRYVKVLTTASPSWVGWAEIEVYGSPTSNPAQIHWLVSDQLGTPRMIFDQSGNLANVSRHDYLPFGEEIFADTGNRTTLQGYTQLGGIAADGVRKKFTSQERDSESNLDYYFSRHYASAEGRFISADSLVGRRVNPQSFNRYSYVVNNPLRFIDPLGLQQQGPKKEDEPEIDPKDVVVINICVSKQCLEKKDAEREREIQKERSRSLLDFPLFSNGALCPTGRCQGESIRQASRRGFNFFAREADKLRLYIPDGIKTSGSVGWVSMEYTLSIDGDFYVGVDFGGLIGGAPAAQFKGKGIGASADFVYILNGGTRDSDGRILLFDDTARKARDSFYTGPALGVQACYWGCLGVQNSGTTYAAVVGAGSPGFTLGPSYGTRVFRFPSDKLPKFNIPK